MGSAPRDSRPLGAGHGFDFCLLVKLKSLPPWGRWAFHDLQAGPSLSAPCP